MLLSISERNNKVKARKIIFFWSIVPFCIVGTFGQSSKNIPALPSSNSWMMQSWTGNDRPYQEIEASIDGRIAKGEAIKSLVEDFEAKSISHPDDPRAQFTWAYVAEKGFHQGMVTDPVYNSLIYADPKNVCRYTRLRFLITRELFQNSDTTFLRPVAYRLLKRNPLDREVRINLIYALDASREGLTEALVSAQQWVNQQPGDAGAHAVLADVYQSIYAYSRGQNVSARDNAIHEFQKYIQLAPENDRFRRQASRLIVVLKNEKPW